MDGILVRQDLLHFLGGPLRASLPLQPAQIQPSSVDLRLGQRIWQLPYSILPGREGIEQRLRQHAFASETLDAQRPTLLRRHGVYIVEVEESLALPADVWGRANPKSSSGRLDVFVRLLTERGMSFDVIPAGYHGKLFLEITPQSFHIWVRRGDFLGQIRLGRGRPRLDGAALRAWQGSAPVVVRPDGSPALVLEEDTPGLELSVDLASDDIVGYRALQNRPPVDLAARDLERAQYWAPIHREAVVNGYVLEPEQFYILATREHLRIPAELCAELVPFDPTKGELRTHYAGFIDPGFGVSEPHVGAAERPTLGARLVLEIRTHDVPFLLEHGQPLFRLELLHNAQRPDRLYGSGMQSHYQMQGLKLAKQFR